MIIYKNRRNQATRRVYRREDIPKAEEDGRVEFDLREIEDVFVLRTRIGQWCRSLCRSV